MATQWSGNSFHLRLSFFARPSMGRERNEVNNLFSNIKINKRNTVHGILKLWRYDKMSKTMAKSRWRCQERACAVFSTSFFSRLFFSASDGNWNCEEVYGQPEIFNTCTGQENLLPSCEFSKKKGEKIRKREKKIGLPTSKTLKVICVDIPQASCTSYHFTGRNNRVKCEMWLYRCVSSVSRHPG